MNPSLSPQVDTHDYGNSMNILPILNLQARIGAALLGW
jgi:hypothetical protein